MSKQKSLSPDQISEMKALVTRGESPKNIADKFKVGISTVHNYKARFKNDGLSFPSVRGRKSGTIEAPVSKAIKNVSGYSKPSSTAPASQVGNTFIVNGIPVTISASAKSVNINKTSSGITFEVNI
jgi:hypothetical protein